MGAAITASFGGVTTSRADQVDVKWSVHFSPISGHSLALGNWRAPKSRVASVVNTLTPSMEAQVSLHPRDGRCDRPQDCGSPSAKPTWKSLQ